MEKMSNQRLVRMRLSSEQKPVSDLSRLRKMSEKKIKEGIKKDKDAAPLSVKWPKDAKVIFPKKKVPVSLRVDQEVLEFYKHQGIGYLSFMNAVLRAYMNNCNNHDHHIH